LDINGISAMATKTHPPVTALNHASDLANA
jgi:hypothetical protein